MTFGNAISEFIDETKTMSIKELAQSLETEPKPLKKDSKTYKFWQDAYLGAVAEYLARLNNLAIPQWADAPNKFLKQAFFDNSGLTSLNATLIQESPLAFRRRGIFTELLPLRRC
jgi:hypothetical protein